MTYVIADAERLTTAASAVARVGSTMSEATAAAAGPTTTALAAGADEVSTATAALFNSYGQECQALIKQAAAFQSEFTAALTAAGNAYAQAEAANAAAMSNVLDTINAPIQTLLGGAPVASTESSFVTTLESIVPSASTSPITALIMGGTGNPGPIPEYVAAVNNNYIQPIFPGATGQGLFTPQQFWPNNPELGMMTFNQSTREGVALLHTAIMNELGLGNRVDVFGYSSSATIINNEILALMRMGADAPNPADLSFTMVGSPNNPVGGLFSRFPGFYIPLMDVPFNGATPADNPYPTSIYTMQYDGAAHAPHYPLNPFATLNSLLGFQYLHGQYPWLTPEQLAGAELLPTSPGYTGNTSYYMLPTQDLPLVQPIRDIPIIGPPLAELIQPTLRVLVDLGYVDYGATGNYADIPTPAALIQIPNPISITYNLAQAAIQGPTAALVEIGLLPESFRPDIYPYVPSLAPGLNISLGQSSVTGLSLLGGALGPILELIPPAT